MKIKFFLIYLFLIYKIVSKSKIYSINEYINISTFNNISINFFSENDPSSLYEYLLRINSYNNISLPFELLCEFNLTLNNEEKNNKFNSSNCFYVESKSFKNLFYIKFTNKFFNSIFFKLNLNNSEKKGINIILFKIIYEEISKSFTKTFNSQKELIYGFYVHKRPIFHKYYDVGFYISREKSLEIIFDQPYINSEEFLNFIISNEKKIKIHYKDKDCFFIIYINNYNIKNPDNVYFSIDYDNYYHHIYLNNDNILTCDYPNQHIYILNTIGEILTFTKIFGNFDLYYSFEERNNSKNIKEYMGEFKKIKFQEEIKNNYIINSNNIFLKVVCKENIKEEKNIYFKIKNYNIYLDNIHNFYSLNEDENILFLIKNEKHKFNFKKTNIIQIKNFSNCDSYLEIFIETNKYKYLFKCNQLINGEIIYFENFKNSNILIHSNEDIIISIIKKQENFKIINNFKEFNNITLLNDTLYLLQINNNKKGYYKLIFDYPDLFHVYYDIGYYDYPFIPSPLYYGLGKKEIIINNNLGNYLVIKIKDKSINSSFFFVEDNNDINIKILYYLLIFILIFFVFIIIIKYLKEYKKLKEKKSIVKFIK